MARLDLLCACRNLQTGKRSRDLGMEKS
uniref:Uncharacterized protein n=1 Tax=Tetranychus urticae TaxID=32264 RepID=T1KE80_TETUR